MVLALALYVLQHEYLAQDMYTTASMSPSLLRICVLTYLFNHHGLNNINV